METSKWLLAREEDIFPKNIFSLMFLRLLYKQQLKRKIGSRFSKELAMKEFLYAFFWSFNKNVKSPLGLNEKEFYI